MSQQILTILEADAYSPKLMTKRVAKIVYTDLRYTRPAPCLAPGVIVHRRTPADTLIVARKGLNRQTIKRYALCSNGNLRQTGANIRSKAVLVHTNELGRISRAQESHLSSHG